MQKKNWQYWKSELTRHKLYSWGVVEFDAIVSTKNDD